MTDRAAVGAAGEEAVARFFEREGFTVVARNWSCKGGELDLVVQKGALIVFVEVRTVTTAWLRSPIDTISTAKQARVARAADAWLQRTEHAYDDLRFDVVGVRLRRMRAPQIDHIPNAFVPPWAW